MAKDNSRYDAGYVREWVKLVVMTILIENADGGDFFTTDSTWTKIPAEAKQFPRTGAAFDVAKKAAIGKFNIVGYVTETKQFINLNHGRGRGLPETLVA